MTECIHGFEGTLCAACFPKAPPEPAVVAAAGARLRAAPRRTATVRTASFRTRSLANAGPVDNIAEQRIYHLTHIRNLPAILASGAVFADESPEWHARPVVDISSADAREDRRSRPVAGSGDATVAHFVPFFLSPNAGLWQAIRSKRPDPRIATTIRESDAAEFVILVSTVHTIAAGGNETAERGSPYVVADGDAGHVLTRFATTQDDADRSLRRLRAEPEDSSSPITEAEFLIEDRVAFDAITLIGVAHDKARAAVREILASSDYAPKVSVYPPWFAAPAD